MIKNFISFLSFFIISFFIILNGNISASDYFKEKGEKELYDQGIIHRDKRESDQGLEPPTNDLGKMNLISLLPNEVFAHIVSFFSMKDIYHCNTLCYRTYEAVRSAVTKTNLLTSKSPFAIQFFSLLKGVQFDPMPKEIRLSQLAKVKEGSIEVHFRDTKHLRSIVEEIQLIKPEDRLYFVFDERAQNGKELVPTEGTLQKEYFINFIADTPIKLRGNLNGDILPNALRFPKGSDRDNLKLEREGGDVFIGDLHAYTKAFALASVIDTFNNHSFQISTTDAYQLLEDRQKSRRQSPEMYPNLSDLCPDARLISASNLEIIQKDYISANQPFVYMSKSIKDITELQNKLPDFSESISYINPKISESGVYCEGPLILEKGFEVFSDKDLTISGNIKIEGYNFKITTNGSMWMMGVNMSGRSLDTRGKDDLLMRGYYSERSDNKKPEGMPEEDWQKLLNSVVTR